MPNQYTPAQIASAAQTSVWTARRYLRLRFKRRRGVRDWWRLSADEYQTAVEQLRAAAAIGTGQPLRELARGELFLPMF